MGKKPGDKENNQAGGITHKRDKNAGSGAFNQGSDQDPDYDDGAKVSDEEKQAGTKRSHHGKENPKGGNKGNPNASGDA